MADVKVPALLHKMSVSSQKAWYKKHGMEMPDDTGGRSAAASKKIKLQPRKVVAIEPDSVRAINAARQKKYMEKGGRQPIGAAGSGGSSVMAGSNMSTAKGIVTGIKAGFNPRLSLDPYESERAKKVGPRSLKRNEEVEQVEEAKVDHRELASAGIMHPDMAHAPRMKAGNMTDFYSRKNGDKLHGKILSNDKKTVRIEHEGKVHKFDVHRSIPKPMYGEEVELDEAATQPSDKEIRMARGIAFGKRYKGGNMTAATNAIEKIRQGLSDHPKVAAALRSANEEKEMSHGKKLAKKVMAKQSTHPISQHMGEEAVVEEKDEREYGYEGDMAMSQLKSIIANAQKLHDMLEPDTDLPEWVQSKITLAEDYVVTAANYCAGDLEESVNEEVEQIDELKDSTLKSYVKKANKEMNKAFKYHKMDQGGRDGTDPEYMKKTYPWALAKFDRRDAGVEKAKQKLAKEAAEGKTPETETEVNLAKKHGDPKKITYGDVIKARIQSAKNKALKKGE